MKTNWYLEDTFHSKMLKFKTSKGTTNDVGLGAYAVVVQPTADRGVFVKSFKTDIFV